MKKLLIKTAIIGAVLMSLLPAGSNLYADCPRAGLFINIDNGLDESVTVTPGSSNCWFIVFDTTVVGPNSRKTIYTEGRQRVNCPNEAIELNFGIISSRETFKKKYKLENVKSDNPFGKSNRWVLDCNGEIQYGRMIQYYDDSIKGGCHEFDIIVR